MLNMLTGFCSGVISGMGIGGGAILIPALILLQDISQQTAQGINLVYFLPTAVVSLIIHIRRRRVELKTAAVIGVSGILGAVAGSLIALRLSGPLLRRMFGGFLLLIGIWEVYKGIKMKEKKPIE